MKVGAADFFFSFPLWELHGLIILISALIEFIGHVPTRCKKVHRHPETPEQNKSDTVNLDQLLSHNLLRANIFKIYIIGVGCVIKPLFGVWATHSTTFKHSNVTNILTKLGYSLKGHCKTQQMTPV